MPIRTLVVTTSLSVCATGVLAVPFEDMIGNDQRTPGYTRVEINGRAQGAVDQSHVAGMIAGVFYGELGGQTPTEWDAGETDDQFAGMELRQFLRELAGTRSRNDDDDDDRDDDDDDDDRDDDEDDRDDD